MSDENKPRSSARDSILRDMYWNFGFYSDSKWVLRGISLVLLIGVWQYFAADMFLIATPSEILVALYEQIFVEQRLLWATLEALQVAAGGYFLAVIIGVPVGFTMGFSVPVRNALDPIIDALYSTPLVALIPLMIIIFGLNNFTKVFFVFLMSVFIIIVNTEAGVQETPEELIDAANVFGAKGNDMYAKVYLRSSVPYLLTGLRLGAARAVRGMVTAELFIFAGKLGKYLINTGARYEIANLFAGVVLLSFTGVVVISAARIIEQYLLRYRDPVR